MHGTRHVAALYDLIGKNRTGVPEGVPTKPLLELACIRVAEACAKFLLAKVTGDAYRRWKRTSAARIFACLLTEDTVAMDARCARHAADQRLGSASRTSPTWWRDRSRVGSKPRQSGAAHGGALVCVESSRRSQRWRSGWSRRGWRCSERWARCPPGRTGEPRRRRRGPRPSPRNGWRGLERFGRSRRRRRAG